jgi:hypothetical protein
MAAVRRDIETVRVRDAIREEILAILLSAGLIRPDICIS